MFLKKLRKMFSFATKPNEPIAEQTTVDISVARRKNEEAARRLMQVVCEDDDEMKQVFDKMLGPQQ